jgi:hypothetical protein
MSRLLVLDFDGTMTDAEVEGGPFRAGYLEDLAILTGRAPAAIAAMAEAFEAEVAANPNDHGWVYGGQIVAPASVDPYLRVMPVARKIFDQCGVFLEEGSRNRLLDGILYKYNYSKTNTAFRPGAREVLLSLTGTATHVVTNSHTLPVREKIRSLANGSDELDWLLERVRGLAKKYVIDNDFDGIDEELRLDGLARPILLRRRLYHDVLKGLLDAAGLQWSDLLVVGDIFELDLALPLVLGARIGLVVNQFTPDYERRFVAEHPRGTLVNELSEIPPLLDR